MIYIVDIEAVDDAIVAVNDTSSIDISSLPGTIISNADNQVVGQGELTDPAQQDTLLW
jgi:hypothetical protein